jgi:hypothetical protein
MSTLYISRMNQRPLVRRVRSPAMSMTGNEPIDWVDKH